MASCSKSFSLHTVFVFLSSIPHLLLQAYMHAYTNIISFLSASPILRLYHSEAFCAYEDDAEVCIEVLKDGTISVSTGIYVDNDFIPRPDLLIGFLWRSTS